MVIGSPFSLEPPSMSHSPWSLLLPHPNPHRFQKNKLDSSIAMSRGTPSELHFLPSTRGKLRKPPPASPPPKLQPLLFAEPVVDPVASGSSHDGHTAAVSTTPDIDSLSNFPSPRLLFAPPFGTNTPSSASTASSTVRADDSTTQSLRSRPSNLSLTRTKNRPSMSPLEPGPEPAPSSLSTEFNTSSTSQFKHAPQEPRPALEPYSASMSPASPSVHPDFFASAEASSADLNHDLMQVQSDCGHGGQRTHVINPRSAAITTSAESASQSKRPSLLRNFSLSAASAGSGSGWRKSRKPKPPPPPHPPSSWADVASPQPSSSGGSGWVSASGSTSTSESPRSDFSSTFSKWRKWRKGLSSKGKGGESAYSSRTSLELEEKELGVLPLPTRPPAPPQPAAAVIPPPTTPRRTSHDVVPQHRQRSSKELPRDKGHRRNTSWTDAAVSLLRGSSIDKPAVTSPTALVGPSSTPEFARPGVATVNGRRVLRKERVVVDLNADASEHGHGTLKKGKAKFTLGNESDGDLPLPGHRGVPFHGGGGSNSSSRTNLSVPVQSTAPSVSRPPIIRRDALINQEAPTGRRRWTLANAMTDEGISDAGLVRELERMREVAEGARRREKERMRAKRSEQAQKSVRGAESIESIQAADLIQAALDGDEIEGWDEWDFGRELLEGRDGREILRESPSEEMHDYPMSNEPSPHHIRSVTLPNSSSTTSSSWPTITRALLTCRELIRTERHYLALLTALVAQETATPPPPLMRHYAAELVRASEVVLREMEREPSVRGVARAFLEREEEVEGAYVRWCGVVGGWFMESSGEEDASVDASVLGGEMGDDPPMSPLKRTVSTWRKSMPSIPSLVLDGGSIYGGFGRKERERDKEDDSEENPIPKPVVVKKYGVRELAILPTQRVMRYVLLYRDLLAHTPPNSSSRALVERAVAAACRIADKCDRAQGNAAFILSSGSAAPASTAAASASGSGLRISMSRSSSRRGRRRQTSPSKVLSSGNIAGTTSTSTSSSSSGCTSSTTTTTTTISTSTSTSTSMSASPSSPPASPSRLIKGGKTGNLNSSPVRRLSMSAASLKSLGWKRAGGGGAVPAMPTLGVAVEGVKTEEDSSVPVPSSSSLSVGEAS